MSTTTYSFVVSGLAGLSTLIGCLFLFFKNQKKGVLIGSLGFAAGVMLCVSITDLLPSSYGLLRSYYFVFPALLFCAIAFTCGVIFSMLIDKYLPDNTLITDSHGKKLYRVGLISMLAIILHNVPEGIATFMTTNANVSLGLTLAIAIALHNIPEGISISVPIYYATGSKMRAFLYTFISGISEPFGAFLAYLFLSPFINDFIMGLLLAFIAGIMSHISFYELLPTSCSYDKKKLTFICFGVGVLVMFLNHLLFG